MGNWDYNIGGGNLGFLFYLQIILFKILIKIKLTTHLILFLRNLSPY